ncbi:hypothetical protein EW145_g1377 [Phellinidium pouzarii]|uniref:RING-type E3 ubiquitin transferase n=1 Tax=Phellinidium pouzarii TaxID=167371 RepID=A0A4V3XDN0_9AGAM|nr:hypothetical protein EW145_g1377 [Phellinidium pouzarii]
MTQDELDTCRICSAPAEPDAPLFHPCKCSGTIRYIHQDCLTTWLAHSKKKTCDVCKFKYSFTKVYSPNMPKQIPFVLFLRKFAQQLFWACVMGFRGLMVATIWLAFLPYVTVWTWRFYFVMGENIAWWINDRPRPTPTPAFYSYYSNFTDGDAQNRTDSSNRTFIGFATSYPVWRALSSDIFTGQIIASLIVLVFLGIFLLREWIMQNARPGVFEEDEFDEEVQGAEVRPPNQPVALDDVPLPPQNEQIEQVEQIEQDKQVEPIEQTESATGASSSGLREVSSMGSSESIESNASSETMEVPDAPELDIPDPPRHKRRLYVAKDEFKVAERGLQASRSRTWPSARDRSTSASYSKKKGKARRPIPDRSARDSSEDLPPEIGLAEHPDDFEFTFSVNRSSSPSIDSSPLDRSDMFSFHPPSGSRELLQYKSTPLPFPFTPVSTSPEPTGTSYGIRRPPLPSSNIPPSSDISSNDDSAIAIQPSPLISLGLPSRYLQSSDQPLASPSLATYRAPEELEAGPSQAVQTGYFDGEKTQIADREADSSSAAATVAESAFREDLAEFFQNESSDDDVDDWDFVEGERGPLREENLARHNRLIHIEALNNPREEADAVAEDQDGINDDDVDGALEEAIGMRGPLTTVFQNAALMIFVLDTTIGIAVWLPFTVGKTAALLSLEPIRVLQILQWPIRTIRYITDPIVDSFSFVLSRAIMPSFKALFSVASEPSVDSLTQPNGESKTLLDAGIFKILISRSPDASNSALSRSIDRVANSPVAHFLEPYFTWLGKRVRLNALVLKSTWIELANGDASVNRFFAVVLGYTFVGLLVAFYLNILNVGSVQSAGRAIRNAIRQQLIVAVFIVIELAVFPLGCGVMLDFCTVQLFPDTTVHSRVTFFAYASVTATFYHWVIGTIFMYQFAILLSGCRLILRPGALWFIKDPQDPNFHPIRDILDRPTLTQLRKLAVSAVLYSIVVALGMGGLIFCLRIWGKILLPLRWKLRAPLSDIPVDLLFLHIVMHSTVKYIRPRKFALALASYYWRWAARQLRLTSYMFGGLHPEEMQPSANVSSWLSSFYASKQLEKPSDAHNVAQFDGRYRRVPAQDNIALPREIRATVAVDEHGVPLDDAGRRLMDIQNSEAEKARRDISVDYTLVYLPPHFKERVIIFILSLWIAGSSLFVAAFVIPTLLGRAVFGLAFDREVHDGYSIIVGFYLLWGCYSLVRLLGRIDKRRQRMTHDEPRGDWAVYLFKRSMLWAGNFVWVAFWLGFVIPTLIAVVMEVYLVHPLRIMIKPDLTLNIRVFDFWALGLLYTKMALKSMRFRPETRVDVAVKEMKRKGWRCLDAVPITLDIIAPVTAGLLAILFLPVIVVFGLQQLLPTKIKSSALCQSHPFTLSSIALVGTSYLLDLHCPPRAVLYVYPGIFVCAAFTRMYSTLQVVCGSWAQQIRDTEFLVEMQLRNLELNRPVSVPIDASQSASSMASPVRIPGTG